MDSGANKIVMNFIFTKLGSTLLIVVLIIFGYFTYSALGGTSINITLKTNPDLENGLVGHWTFDGKDMIDNVADVSGQGNNGALQGQTSTTTAIGKIGQALDFDGSDDFIRIPDSSSLDIGSAITISAWVNTTFDTDTLANNQMRILDKFAGATQDGYALSLGDGTEGTTNMLTVNAGLVDGTNMNTLTGTTDIIDGAWHFVTFTYDSTTGILYVDGIQEASVTDSGAIEVNALTVLIGGNNQGGDREFDGQIDDVRIYNRALSAEEISRLYDLGGTTHINVTLPSVQDGLVGHWTFDGKDMINNVADVSGQGNNGVIVGQTSTTTAVGVIGQALDFDGTDDYVIAGAINGSRVSATTIGTSTDTDAIWAGSQRNAHYANGYYWAVFYDGGDPVIYSSSDGSTWNSQGDLNSTASLVEAGNEVSVRFSGTNMIVSMSDDSANKLYYRNGTLDSDGGVTWNANDQSFVTDGQVDKNNHVGFDSDGFPWVGGIRNSGGTLRIMEGDALNTPTFTTRTPSGWGAPPYSNAQIQAGTIFQGVDSGDMVFLFGVIHSGRADSNDMLVNAWDSSGGVWNGWTTEVDDDLNNSVAIGAKNGWSAVKTDDGKIHLVYIDLAKNINHVSGTDAMPPVWSSVDSDVTALTSHTKLTLSTDGTDLYLFYDKGDEKIYYRKYDGSWGSESNLKTDATAIVGAISSYESAQNGEIGVIWAEGAGSPYDVRFASIPTDLTKTISFWMNADDVTTRDIIDMDGTDQIDISAGSAIQATSFPAATVYVDGVVASTVTANTWHFITVTDSTGVAASALNIGREASDSTNEFDGTIDDVRIYDRTLSAEEISRLYDLGGTTHVNVTLKTNPALESGLVGHWTFDGKDMISNVADVSGQGNHGSLQGQTSTTTAIGKIGQALSFDGSDDYVDISYTFPNTPHTWSLWTYTDSVRQQWMLSAQTLTNGWGIGNIADGKFYAYSSDPNDRWKGNVGDVVAGVWQHWVVIYNGVRISNVYRNGIELTPSENNSGTPISSANSIRIGGLPDAFWSRWNSKLDDVRVYNRALSADEVKRLYDMGR